MKKTATLLLLASTLLVTLSASAQVYKYKATEYSIQQRIGESKWEDWTSPEKIEVLITFNINGSRIKVYLAEIQNYDIITHEIREDNKKESIWDFECVDDEGNTCLLTLIASKTRGGQQFLIISNSTNRIKYAMYIPY